jgi:hypothetical protein
MKNDDTNNPFDPKRLRLDATEQRAVVPKKVKEWRERYALFPMAWVERLKGAPTQTWATAVLVVYLDFWENTRRGKKSGQLFKLANGMLKIYGIPPTTKRRTLRDLEHRGLITAEWRPKRTPIVKLCKIAAP